MRQVSLITLLMLSALGAHAQNGADGFMVFKAHKPYVSPFDKQESSSVPKGVSESPSLPPSLTAPNNQPAWSPTEVQKPTPMVVQEVSPKAVPILTPPPESAKEPPVPRQNTKTLEAKSNKNDKVENKNKSTAHKKESSKNDALKAEPSVVVKKIDPPVVKAATLPPDANSSKTLEESVMPPAELQKPTAALAPPPGKEGLVTVPQSGLTSFKNKETNPPLLSSTTAPKVTSITTPESNMTEDASAQEKSTASPTPMQDSEPSSSTPWYLKAMLLIALGGAVLSGVWRWLKYQAVHGDPAYKDPWFSAHKVQQLKF